MPYIVTTTPGLRGIDLLGKSHTGNLRGELLVSRRAVATLDEAQRETAQTIADHNGKREGLPAPVAMTPDERGRADDAIGEQGGHYSLPDGTVIEVEQVLWTTLATGWTVAMDDHAAMIAAYNTAQ